MSARVAILVGPVGRPELLAVSADPTLAAKVADLLLNQPSFGQGDPALAALEHGRRESLRAIVAGRPRPSLRVLSASG